MAWVKFTEDFDWWPSPQVTIAYKAGMTLNVTRRCAESAKAKGKAVSCASPRKALSVDGKAAS